MIGISGRMPQLGHWGSGSLVNLCFHSNSLEPSQSLAMTTSSCLFFLREEFHFLITGFMSCRRVLFGPMPSSSHSSCRSLFMRLVILFLISACSGGMLVTFAKLRALFAILSANSLPGMF